MNIFSSIYQQSCQISDFTWQIIQFWSVFDKQIIGQYFLKCVDDASVNLGKTALLANEKVKIKYLNLAIENLIDANLWLDKAKRRKLVSQKDYKELYGKLTNLEYSIKKATQEKKV
ncbi:hypothetical protein GYA19_02635 [Candidatus Beckwithbacteria bacterium]|nr:hypothetical protein [Candidatus Beckwithbacteria bacterium]